MPRQNEVRAKRSLKGFRILGSATDFSLTVRQVDPVWTPDRALPVTDDSPKICKNLSLFSQLQVIISLSSGGETKVVPNRARIHSRSIK